MQLITFLLGEVTYGIAIESVQSIEKQIPTVSIPNSFPCIKGIINLHGNIVPVYNLSKKMGYPETEVENLIIVEVDNMQIGLEVRKVNELLTVKPGQVLPMPEIISGTQNFLTDVANDQKHLIVLLDVRRLISEEEQQNLQTLIENAVE